MRRLCVLGATGAIGARLVPAALEAGWEVAVLARCPEALASRPWHGQVTVVAGNATVPADVARAAEGAQALVALVHPIEGRVAGLVAREEALAAAVRDGGHAAGVDRMVCLGGLVAPGRLRSLSAHMYGRVRFGQVLAAGPVAVTELRAGIVIDAESASFHLLLAAARSPVALQPRPADDARCQPIGGHDAVAALLAAADPRAPTGVLDLGGPDVLTYTEMVAVVRDELGARPSWRVGVRHLPVELLGPLAARRAGTDSVLAVALLASSRRDAVVGGRDAAAELGLAPRGFREAVRAALAG